VGLQDWPFNNYAIVRDRNGGRFQFFNWDGEFSLLFPNDDITPVCTCRTSPSPGTLYVALQQNKEFRQLFADRLELRLRHRGALSPEGMAARFAEITAEVKEGLFAESLRWGDAVSTTPLSLVQWQKQADFLTTRYFPARSETVITQLQNRGMYPLLAPPALTFLESERRLQMAAAVGAIYFTLDGSDPRSAGGEISPTARVYSEEFALENDSLVFSRTYDGFTWSALQRLELNSEPASATNLRVSEIQYHPSAPSPAEISEGFSDENEFEYLELLNIGASDLRLDEVTLGKSPRADGTLEGVYFAFRNSAVTRLGPGERVVVVENEAAFRLRYGDQIVIAGKWDGKLSNSSETISVYGPDGPIEVITYSDEWFRQTDGSGRSLELLNKFGVADDWSTRSVWMPSSQQNGSPGRAGTSPDFDHDGVLSATDIDLLFAAVSSGTAHRDYDLTGDAFVDSQDTEQMIRQILAIPYGDATLDGVFNSADLIMVLAAGAFESSQPAFWASGDWNGDQLFNTSDLVQVFQAGGYQR
jgi:hypothetical protein